VEEVGGKEGKGCVTVDVGAAEPAVDVARFSPSDDDAVPGVDTDAGAPWGFDVAF
jgi:hypothetical protein